MSESQPEESLPTERDDAQVSEDATTEPVKKNDTAPDTVEEGNAGVAEETSTVEQPTLETSAVKEDMPEDAQSATAETAATEGPSLNGEDTTARTQDEEFVVIQLTDGEQAESQGTN